MDTMKATSPRRGTGGGEHWACHGAAHITMACPPSWISDTAIGRSPHPGHLQHPSRSQSCRDTRRTLTSFARRRCCVCDAKTWCTKTKGYNRARKLVAIPLCC